MGEWVDIGEWHRCAEMMRPGIIFEIRNGAGQSLLTPCAEEVPVPFDWSLPPLAFRAIPEPPPEHSDPIPEPVE